MVPMRTRLMLLQFMLGFAVHVSKAIHRIHRWSNNVGEK